MPISTIGANGLNKTEDFTIDGLTVGKGGGNVATNTAVGVNALLSNTSGANNTVVGSGAMADNTSGSLNTAMGRLALNANTTGANNTGLGYQALALNTTASNNTAVGYQSLYNNVSANCTAVGFQAGYSNGGGAIQNTSVGSQAGYSQSAYANQTAIGYAALYSSNANWNTAVGSYAAQATTTGYYNSTLGTESMYSNTTGINNVAMGVQALRSRTTTSYNTAIGYQAGYLGTTGGDNTFVGALTGYNTTGGSNAFFGYGAGYNATSGTNNTFIGIGAGENMTTGSKNTILGKYNGNQGGLDIRTASNYIVLSDGDGNPRVTINGSGNVGIGTITSPSGSSGGTAFASAGAYGVTRLLFSSNNTATIAMLAFDNPNGNVGSVGTSGSSTYYATSSDYRLKENIASMQNALGVVAQLKPVTYNWKSDGSAGQGFIAHELQEVVPDAVVGEKDAVDTKGNPVYQGIDTSFLVATLTAAIQELNAKVEALEAKLASK